MRSFDTLNKADIILSSSEEKDLETAVQSIIEVTSWMGWWTFAMKSKPLSPPVRHGLLGG